MSTIDDVVIQTIYEIVRNIFEDDTAKTIFQYSRETGPESTNERVKAFADSLPKILGAGSVIIEDLVLETLYSKFGLELEWRKNYRFTDYVVELKNRTEGGRRK